MTLGDAVALEPIPDRIYLDVEGMCVSIGGSRADAPNALALELARRYLAGEVSLRTTEAVLNNFASYCRSIGYLPQCLATPKTMYSVFFAFQAELHPEHEYFRPRLADILTRVDGPPSNRWRGP